MDPTLNLGDLLPMAVGIALSPVPIAAVILMLFSAKARVNGPLFVAGWIIGLGVVGGVALVLGGGSTGSTSEPSAASLWVKSILGFVLLLVGVREWRSRPRSDDEASLPRWMESIDAFTPAQAFGIAILLSGLNPKNLAFDLAGVIVIAQGGLEPRGEWVALAIFVMLASLAISAPVVYYFVAGERAEKSLASMKSWLIRNNTAVIGVLLFVFGLKLLAEGLQGLFG